ncbi:hypothetical protein [Streptomyces sp. NPDC017988]|uniref:hypothetical protein n=1 Tax=Streptomyces sp. NPDC017988 TaxID=3365025 RepID=UPI0037ADD98F
MGAESGRGIRGSAGATPVRSSLLDFLSLFLFLFVALLFGIVVVRGYGEAGPRLRAIRVTSRRDSAMRATK